MTRKIKLEKAIEEALHFLAKAKEALKEINDYHKEDEHRQYRHEPTPSRKYSATKRASLDLAAALVELRKP